MAYTWKQTPSNPASHSIPHSVWSCGHPVEWLPHRSAILYQRSPVTVLDTILQHTSVCIFFLPSHKPRLEQPGTRSCRLSIPQRLQNSLEGHHQVASPHATSIFFNAHHCTQFAPELLYAPFCLQHVHPNAVRILQFLKQHFNGRRRRRITLKKRSDIHHYPTRQINNLTLSLNKKSFCDHAIRTVSGLHLRNSLPQKLKE